MKIYLVGGAVRDKLLGLAVKDRDWVVVGATVVDMIEQGYKQVGKSFPVFLHPQTNEEYALARTERKVGPGYKGFEFNATESVSLQEDLQRRDLTINAIAESTDGEMIDPYGGINDLQSRVLRHVSPAFIEDPVRILRIARFSAQFAKFNFTIAPETLTLMKHMVAVGEVDHLVAERVWHELYLALGSGHPEYFFSVLMACDAMPRLFPQISNLSALQHVSEITDDESVRFATIFQDGDVAAVNDFCRCYRPPKNFQELAVMSVRYQAAYQGVLQASATEILDLLLALDAMRREQRFEKFLLVSQFFIKHSAAQAKHLRQALSLCKSISPRALIDAGKKGHELAQALHQQRLKLLTSKLI